MQSLLTKILCGIAIVCGCHASSPGEKATDAPHSTVSAEVFRRTANAVVQVETPHRAGVGFVVREEGWIATTHGLIDGESQARVVLADGRLFAVERVLASDEARDIAIVAIEGDGLPVVPLSEAPAHVHDRVAVVGHALGMLAPTASEAVVDAVSVPGRRDALRLSLPTPGGHAGAPVIDARGRVVAMVGSGLADDATIAMPATRVAKLMHGLRAGAGESMREFGTRTDGVEDEPGLASSLDAGDLADCSTASRERIWHEVRGALQIAAPVYEAGADEAAFRVLEGATLRLRGELDDCRAVLAALDEARVAARQRPNPTEAARVLGLSFEHVVDLLFARSEPAVVPRPARLPSTPVTG